MIFIDKMKNFKIYKISTFLPTKLDDKKKGSAILLFTPNYDSSKRLMTHPMFINKRRYLSYYIEKDISYYINDKIKEVDEEEIVEEQTALNAYLVEMTAEERNKLPDSAFGVPSKRKFPLDTEAHVRSAIKFFNYVDPEDEETLARNIIKAMKKFDIYGKVSVSSKNRFSKYYKVGLKEETEISESDLDISVEYFRSLLPESALDLGDQVMFFNEASPIDLRLKKLLYKPRIRYRKQVIALLDQVKKDIPFLKFAFPEMKRYMNKNLFVDLYYYNSIFYQNNTWVNKRGLNLNTEFMIRLINHPKLKEYGYNYKTIFIPVKDWDLRNNNMVWNFRSSINPISCIYQMMYTGNISLLKKAFGNNNIIFVGSDKYFKVNFSQINMRDIKKLATKFKLFTVKICRGEEFDPEDIDTSADNIDSPEVIQAKIADKIEDSKNIDITKNIHKANKKLNSDYDKITLDANGDPISNLKNTPTKKSISPANTEKKDKDNAKIFDNAMTRYASSNDSNLADNLSVQSNKVLKTVKAAKKKDDEDDEEEYSKNNSSEEQQDDTDRDKDVDKLADAIVNSSNSDSNDNEEDTEDDLDSDEEIKKLLASIGSDEDEVNISAARAARINELNEKLMDKEVKGKSIRDILDEEKNKPKEEYTSVDTASPNKEEWTNLTYLNFDKNYNIDKDIINIFKHFSHCSRPISIRDIKVTDNSTSEDRVELYDVDMEDYRGKRFRIKLDIPVMEDNRFLLRGNSKTIQTQFFNTPIIKTELDTCQLISNYKKIFLRRYGSSSGKSTPIAARLLKALNKYQGNEFKIAFGDNTNICSKYQLPLDYIDIAGSISTIESDKWIVYFNQDQIRSLYTIETGKGFPFAYNKALDAVEYFPPQCKDSFAKMLYLNLAKTSKKFEDLFGAATRPTVCTYSKASIANTKIPVAVMVGYFVGLRNMLDRSGIEYTIEEKLTKDIRSNIDLDWIKFSDAYIVYKYTYESGLLLNGLKDCPTELHGISEVDSKSLYLEFLDDYGGRIKADFLDNFRDLFVDPMILESLKFYKLPTDFIDILLYGNALLADNKFIKHTDMSSRRLRRYQLISVYTYLALSEAYGKYSIALKHSRNAAEFSVKQSAVIDLFLTDSITSDDSCINALRDVEATNSVTAKGPSGMNNDRAYSIDKRSYDESMLNVLGMSTGFAGNVGITRQTTINPNVTPDGYIKTNKGKNDMDDASSLSITEALIPFGSTRDDPMRTAMSFVQTSKHMVRTEESDPLLVTSGADEVMPYLTTNKFAYKAKDNGTVKEVTDDYIVIEYSNGKNDYISLKETIEKNSDGGYYVPLKIDAASNIKVGTKVKKNQIVAYDRYSFSGGIGESNNLAYNIGKIAKVAVLNTDEGFEDSGIISQSMCKKLATRIDVKYEKVIEKDAKIFYIAKMNQHIEAGDDLLIWQDAVDDEDAESVIKGLSNLDDISELGKRRIKSEVTGTLKGIKIFRTTELSEMSDSLRKIITEYEKPLVAESKKLTQLGLPTTNIPAHYILPATGKLKKAQNAVYIEFYVEYLDTVGVGDKVVYNSANKAVEKSIFPEGLEPYTDFRPNEIIDAFVSESSIDKRIVTSTFVYGSLQKLMIELDRHVKDIMGITYDDSTI